MLLFKESKTNSESAEKRSDERRLAHPQPARSAMIFAVDTNAKYNPLSGTDREISMLLSGKATSNFGNSSDSVVCNALLISLALSGLRNMSEEVGKPSGRRGHRAAEEPFRMDDWTSPQEATFQFGLGQNRDNAGPADESQPAKLTSPRHGIASGRSPCDGSAGARLWPISRH